MEVDFKKAALIIIDIQNDFCPGGALAVEYGDTVIEPLNTIAHLFTRNSGLVVATQDWHPLGHVSFKEWPAHCVQGTRGADFHKNLDLKPINLIIRKGFRSELDSYSVFFENDRETPTGLDGFFKSFHIETLILGGLATDYCVLYSALDASFLGYKTFVVNDAIKGINVPKGSIDKAVLQLNEAGVSFIESKDIK